MRRLSGRYEGVDYVVLEYTDGQVECPMVLYDVLHNHDGTMPQGVELEHVCRLLFGDTLRVQEG